MKIKFEREGLINLDISLATVLVPRLREFKKERDKLLKQDILLDDIIEAFEILANSNGESLNAEQQDKVDEGLKEFSSKFQRL